MEIIKLNDIDLSILEKSRFQGSTSTIYKNNDTCIKMLDKLFQEEKQYISILDDKNKALIEVPYMDEVICDSDDYIIDREKQLSIKQKILRKL